MHLLLLLLLAICQLAAAQATLVHVSGLAPEIVCFSLDPGAGLLTPASVSPGGERPIALAWSPGGEVLYAVNAPWDKPGRILAFRCDPADGSLTRIAEVASGGVLPCHVAVHPGGKWVFTAHYMSGHVAVLPVRPDGGLGEATTVVEAGKNAHMAMPSPDGRFLLVPCLGSDHISIYAFDAMTGHLTPADPATVALPAGSGPRHAAFHANCSRVTIINEKNSTLTTFSRDPASGRLGDPHSISTLPEGYTGANTGARLVASRDGAWLYASNRGHDSVLSCRIATDTGLPTPQRHIRGDGLVVPTDFALDASGTLLLAVGQKSALLSVFRLDPAGGEPTRLGAWPVRTSPTCVVLRPTSLTDR